MMSSSGTMRIRRAIRSSRVKRISLATRRMEASPRKLEPPAEAMKIMIMFITSEKKTLNASIRKPKSVCSPLQSNEQNVKEAEECGCLLLDPREASCFEPPQLRGQNGVKESRKGAWLICKFYMRHVQTRDLQQFVSVAVGGHQIC